MKKLIFLLCYISHFMYAFPQKCDMTPQTPDVTTFSQFGDYPISYYSGTPQISIPLFTIKEKEVEIPISVQYSGGGLRVADQSTWVGLGWSLIPGGYITRIVNGDDDNYGDGYKKEAYDSLLYNWDNNNEMKYFRYNLVNYFQVSEDFYGVRGERSVTGGGTDIHHFPFGYSFLETLSNSAHLYLPDFFTFNVLGYSGKFYIDPETGIPVVLDKKTHLVIEKNSENWEPEEDGWKITLPNGIEVFLEDIEKVKQNVSPCGNSRITASLTWKISKIKLLNGEEINFTYQNSTYEMASIFDSDILSYMDDEDYAHNRNEFGNFELPVIIESCTYNKKPIKATNNLKVLTQISSPQYLVKFNCDFSESKPKLDSIIYYNKNNPTTKQGYVFTLEEFKKVESYWDLFGTSGLRVHNNVDSLCYRKYKLKSLQKFVVKENVLKYENPYQFSYIENIGLPGILSFAQDYWGYYNGRHENNGLIPDESQMYANGGFVPDLDELRKRANSNRGADSTYMVQGILNKITYPTKGITEFVYEPNQFELSDMDDYILQADEIRYVSGRYYGNYYGRLDALSKGAGLRIKEILNYDSDETVIARKEFRYSNGLLLEPTHFWRIDHKPVIQNPPPTEPSQRLYLYKVWSASGSNYNSSFLLPNSVGYGHVTIFQKDNYGNTNGKTQYSFHNYETVYNPKISRTSYNYLDLRNGLPIRTQYFNENNDVVKSTNYEYKKLESSMYLSMTVKNVNSSTVEREKVFAIEYTPLVYEFWKEDSISEYESGLTIKTKFDYSDEGFGNILNKKVTNSLSSYNETSFFYPTDISFVDFEEIDCYTHCLTLKDLYRLCQKDCFHNICDEGDCTEDCQRDCNTEMNSQCGGCISDGEFNLDLCVANCEAENSLSTEGKAIQAMISKNMISIPLQTIEKRDGNTIGGNFTTYKKMNSGAIVPNASYNIEIEEPKSSITAPHIDEGGTLVMDESFKDKIYFDNYDEYGNITQVHKTGDIPTSYLWGYNNTLPVAKIVGLSYDEVTDKVSPDDIQEKTGEDLSSMLAPLRDLDAMVTIYTYDPLIGMTSMTNENGLTTHYEYDDFGRLKCTRDDDGNIINTYKYHYAGEGE